MKKQNITFQNLQENLEKFNYKSNDNQCKEIIYLLKESGIVPKEVEDIKKLSLIIRDYFKRKSIKIKNNHGLNIISRMYFQQDWNKVSVSMKPKNKLDSFIVDVQECESSIDKEINPLYNPDLTEYMIELESQGEHFGPK